MRHLYIIFNIVLSVLGIAVLWVCAYFSLASKDYFMLHFAPHLVEHTLLRFAADLIVIVMMLVVLLLINYLLLKLNSSSNVKGILQRTLIVHALVLSLAAAGWVGYGYYMDLEYISHVR